MTWDEYKKKYPEAEFGLVHVRMAYEREDVDKITPTQYEMYLEHSCDEWVIGGAEDGKNMVKDLEKAIEFIENQL